MGIAGYNVYYGTTSGGYQNQLPVDANSTTAALSGLADATKYFFAVTAVDAFGVESDFSTEVSYLMPGNQAPTISAISDRAGIFNQTTAAIPFTINDAETSASSLNVAANSSSTTLVPNANIALGGSGQNRTLTITPAFNQVGSTRITVMVSDGTNTANSSFVFSISQGAINTPPTISGIAAQTLTVNQATAAIPFTIGDSQTSAANLTLSKASSSTTLVPTANIVFGGSGANRTVKVTPAANQTGSSQITISVSDGTNTTSSAFTVTVNPAAPNTPPTVSAITAQTVAANQATAAIPFTIGDAETAATSLIISKTSSSTTLVPTANIVLGGSGANRTVKVTPAANQSGSAQITVSVSDGTNSTSSSFTLTVQAPGPNTPPTISAIAAQAVAANQATAAIPFTIGDTETAATSLTVSGTSSSTTLVPNANIVFGGSGANRTVKVTPAANQSGSAQITVSVSDGTNSASSSFTLAVQAGLNTPPTISAIPNQAGYVDHSVGPIPFTIGDAQIAAGSLTVSAVSSDLSIVPSANVVFGGSGANRTATITPAPGQIGSADITISVSDGTTNAQTTFSVSFDQPTSLQTSDLPASSTYSGLYYEDDAVRLQSAGSFKVTVTSGGKYSGTLQTAASRYSFSGQFGAFCQGTNVIVRKGLRSLALNFGLNAGASNNRFVGGISDGVFASQMHGAGTTFNSVTRPAPYIGGYTLALPGQDISTSVSLGSSFGSLQVDGGGNVRLSGMLADGTKISQSSQLSDDGTWPLFVPLYKGKGLLIAWISFTNRTSDDLHGAVNWIKQPDLLAHYYPGGFALAGDAIGSAFTPVSALALSTQIARLQSSSSASTVVTSIKASATTGIFSGSLTDRTTGKPFKFQGALLQKPDAGYGFILGVKQSAPILLTN